MHDVEHNVETSGSDILISTATDSVTGWRTDLKDKMQFVL